ncbi:hypothetical protein EDB84DRAFT_990061 [Lactarius hengduanensis]|nr:hypothetical protein EDB84DRAFT_990061 [Lactarius hengduanensis]
MFAPVINPQSPFRNPFSGLIWYLKQKVHPRSYLDRASGGMVKAVSPNISQGQVQLAMEENDERKDRDVRVIRWLIDNQTEDDEMESFVMAIPGAFTSQWGIDVWRKASKVTQDQDKDFRPNDPTLSSQSDADLLMLDHRSSLFQRISSPLSLFRPIGRTIGMQIANGTSHDATLTRLIARLPGNGQTPDDPHAHLAIYDLCKRVRHLIDTCGNPIIFTNEGLWNRRARGCVETAASLVLCAGIEPELFGDLSKLLHPLHQFIIDMWRGCRAPGADGLFFARLSCLSFMIVNRGLANQDSIKRAARAAIFLLSRFETEEGEQSDDEDGSALRNARRIDNYFETARQFCLHGLRGAFGPGMTEEQVKKVLNHEDVSMLERIIRAAGPVANIDEAIFMVTEPIYSSPVL